MPETNPAAPKTKVAPRIATADDLEAVKALNVAYKKMTEQLARVIVGQNEVIEQVLVAIFCRGHALLVGVPGLAKTLLISTASRLLQLSFKRIQFTPDLMPSDITGTDVLEEDRTTGKRVFPSCAALPQQDRMDADRPEKHERHSGQPTARFHGDPAGQRSD